MGNKRIGDPPTTHFGAILLENYHRPKRGIFVLVTRNSMGPGPGSCDGM